MRVTFPRPPSLVRSQVCESRSAATIVEQLTVRDVETGASAGVRVGVLLQDADLWPLAGRPEKRAPGTSPSRDPRQYISLPSARFEQHSA